MSASISRLLILLRVQRGQTRERSRWQMSNQKSQPSVSNGPQPSGQSPTERHPDEGINRGLSLELALKKLAEETEKSSKAERAAKEQSSFLAMMSHEIRNPLNGLMGSLQLLQMT